MNSWRKYIPEGTRDILLEECEDIVYMENLLREIYIKRGFVEIKSPTLEFYDVFVNESSILPQEKMYKLFDNLGRILVLRPDMTTPIARIASTKLKEIPHPLKLFYNANVYRLNEDLNGRHNEIMQSGVEIIGANGLKADVEVIVTGIEALKGIGLEDFKIEIGEANFVQNVINEIEVDKNIKKELCKYIGNKNFTAIEEFIEDNKNTLKKDIIYKLRELPKLFGSIEILKLAKSLTTNNKALKALNNLEELYEVLKQLGYEKYLSLDLSMFQNLNYYTGTIFRAYVHTVGDSILSGGRYDNLTKNFGGDKAATGFAIDLYSAIKALKNKEIIYENKIEKVLIYYKDDFKKAYKYGEELRKKGAIVELSLIYDEKEAETYAKTKNMKVIKI
ncbi:ATP phosphoribosyltransferase regulatory subunit [Clostridium sporogenes]|uniref:ATP phosphoribosyltransferase regulatory subunit n=1 Tax=Clostridium TaxID=1485 RepID=UPI0017ACF9CB|nr:ATP phosphoribosyltransferase regulatory subunit [Clostridium cochlearium]MBU5269723.1 ATP phosphoribosyltransferase regulatory subunit [Clostridium cochlearium]NMA58603.1 ATP phosphoribosyltransferase regulatory subunit [Clostridium cochlearium]